MKRQRPKWARSLRAWRFYTDHTGKGAFIRKYGREAWERLPAYAIVKDGKRAYVTREAIEDNLWKGSRHDLPMSQRF